MRTNYTVTVGPTAVNLTAKEVCRGDTFITDGSLLSPGKPVSIFTRLNGHNDADAAKILAFVGGYPAGSILCFDHLSQRLIGMPPDTVIRLVHVAATVEPVNKT